MNRLAISAATAALLLLSTSAAFSEAPDGWHRSLDKGLEAAKKSGKPLLLITAWKRKL